MQMVQYLHTGISNVYWTRYFYQKAECHVIKQNCSKNLKDHLIRLRLEKYTAGDTSCYLEFWIVYCNYVPGPR